MLPTGLHLNPPPVEPSSSAPSLLSLLTSSLPLPILHLPSQSPVSSPGPSPHCHCRPTPSLCPSTASPCAALHRLPATQLWWSPSLQGGHPPLLPLQPRPPVSPHQCLPPASHTLQRLLVCLLHLHPHQSTHPALPRHHPLWPEQACPATSCHPSCCCALHPAIVALLPLQSLPLLPVAPMDSQSTPLCPAAPLVLQASSLSTATPVSFYPLHPLPAPTATCRPAR